MERYPYYAPDFKIKINGQELPAALRASITRVSYEDGVASRLMQSQADTQAADRVEISFANPDVCWLQDNIRGLGFLPPLPTALKVGSIRAEALPPGLFDLDNKLTLAMGYASGPLSEMFKGEITGLEADFPSSGMPTVALIAHDYLHRLAQGTYARSFGLIPDYLIATILSAENLLLPAIDPVVSGASTAIAVLNAIFTGAGRSQKAQSDLELLKEIADAYDADFWVEGDVLFLSRVMGKEYSPRLTLTWGESLLSFKPRVSTIGQVVGVSVKFTISPIPLDFLVTASWDFDRACLSVSVIPGAAAAAAKSLVGSALTVINRTINSPPDIVNSALFITRMLRHKVNNRLTGSGSAVGDPNIRAGAVIRLDGLGYNFSGDYRVVSATHTIDSGGYRTNFTVQKEIIP